MCGLATVIKGAYYENMAQNGSFGAQYFSSVPLPVNTDVNNIEYQYPEELYAIMLETDSQYNYVYPRIPVKSELNIDRWKHYLQDYHKPILIHFLEFGFPLGILGRNNLQSEPYNHPSAPNYPQDVEHYLNTEISHKAIWGPYDSPPLSAFHTSPFLSRPKPNSAHRCMIVDRSWPQGASVNFATSSHVLSLCSKLSNNRSNGSLGCTG